MPRFTCGRLPSYPVSF